MHSPSRVQIPPSPRMTPALRKKRGGFVFAGPSDGLARGVCGLKDKKCWFCGDFSACWCGNIGVEGGCVIVGMRISECSVRGHLTAHVGPITCTWARWVVAWTLSCAR